MQGPRSGVPRVAAYIVGLLVLVMLGLPALPAHAASTIDVTDGAVVNLRVDKGISDLVVTTWDRNAVQIDAADDSDVTIQRRPNVGGLPATPTIPGARPEWLGDAVPPGAALPAAFSPEEFPLSNLRPGPHDAVNLVVPGGQRVVLTVPASLLLLNVQHGGAGLITIQHYRGANLIATLGGGRLAVEDANTTAFLQLFRRGGIAVSDSRFERVRARSGMGQIVFERTHVRQVEASSVVGNVLFDNGTFDPGLARFETERGIVAVGTSGNVQLAGRAFDGHVFTQFERRVNETRTPDGALVTLGNGGTLVNAVAQHGTVYLYDGSLASRREASDWRPLMRAFAAHRTALANPSAGSRDAGTPPVVRRENEIIPPKVAPRPAVIPKPPPHHVIRRFR